MAHPKNLSSSSSSSSSSSTVAVANRFVRDSVQFLIRCKKPDKREFIKVAQAVGTGFIIMGFIGYFIKLIHIPINNIIVA